MGIIVDYDKSFGLVHPYLTLIQNNLNLLLLGLFAISL